MEENFNPFTQILKQNLPQNRSMHFIQGVTQKRILDIRKHLFRALLKLCKTNVIQINVVEHKILHLWKIKFILQVF